MIESVITLLIYLVILGIVFYLVIWVLGQLGIPVPTRVVQLVGVLIFLIVLLAFFQGGLPTWPRHVP